MLISVAGLKQLSKAARVRQRLAFAPGTWANKVSHLKLFLLFAAHFSLPSFPTTLCTLRLFMEFLACSFSSPKAVADAVASVRFHHQRLGLPLHVFDHLQVKLALRSLKFTMRTLPKQAAPFPAPLLHHVLRAAASWDRGQRLSVRSFFAFFSFARLGSLLPPDDRCFDPSRYPVLADLGVGSGRAQLRIKFSKTRQHADGGFSVPFLPSESLPCPVSAARRLLHRAALVAAPSGAPLFARFAGSDAPLLSMSQHKARSFLRTTLLVLGRSPSEFSFHSFRRGGCTHAFAGGALESDLALHGDWKSEAIRGYYPRGLAQLRVAQVLARASPSPTPSLFA